MNLLHCLVTLKTRWREEGNHGARSDESCAGKGVMHPEEYSLLGVVAELGGKGGVELGAGTGELHGDDEQDDVLIGESDEAGEDHAFKADMDENLSKPTRERCSSDVDDACHCLWLLPTTGVIASQNKKAYLYLLQPAEMAERTNEIAGLFPVFYGLSGVIIVCQRYPIEIRLCAQDN